MSASLPSCGAKSGSSQDNSFQSNSSQGSSSQGGSAFAATLEKNKQEFSIIKTLSSIKHPLFIMSGKGGVGKSSITVNLAAALAQKGFSVGILDVDLHGPSVPGLLGLSQDGLDVDPIDHLLIPANYKNMMKVLSVESLLKNKDSAVLWRGPKKASAIRQFIADVKWGALDFLLIDSPPGTSDEHMTILKAIPHIKSIVVTTSQEVSLADVRKALNFLDTAKGEVLGVIENMSGLSCPHCGEDIELFKKGGGEKLAADMHFNFLGAIPLDPIALVAAETGTPVVLMEQDSASKKAFFAIADTVVALVQKDSAIT